jgi:hypothetical protein
MLFYIASAGNFDLLLDTDGGAQQDRFVEGAGTLATRVAEGLGDQVVLGAPGGRRTSSRRAGPRRSGVAAATRATRPPGC